MLKQIRKKIDEELDIFLKNDTLALSLAKTNHSLYRELSRFVLNGGKRIRPSLFILAYEGFSASKTKSIYKTAIAFELLHDFFLIHDDIIDRSDLRRGLPSIHRALSGKINPSSGLSLKGSDLAIIAGDILFSFALRAFLSAQNYSKNALPALEEFINCSFYTEVGEYIEMLESLKPIAKVKKDDIYKIYELKTAKYTFSYPLSIGAQLAQAPKKTTKALYNYGILLGTAFQIQDDIIGLFSNENKSGKSSLSDLNEAKKTILIYNAFKKACPGDKKIIKTLLSKPRANQQDLKKIRSLVEKTGSLTLAKKEVNLYFNKSKKILDGLKIKRRQKEELNLFAKQILGI
jgi:geranylgeranyl diphosphate synthase type I